MTFVHLALACALLAFGPQVVLSFNTISFSAVDQCGNFSVHFSGGKLPASLPLILTVVPFNLTPVSIPISTYTWDPSRLTGALFTFLPFPVDTQFVASLDDANGVGTGNVSDVLRIDPSANSTCLSMDDEAVAERYTITTPLAQCQDFNVTYDPSVVDAAPTVRAFVPKGPSIFLNQDVAASSPGTAPYSMAGAEGEQVVFAFSDDTGFRQASDLLTVGGNSSSSAGCLPNSSSGAMSKPSTSQGSSSGSHSGLSKGGVVAIAVVCSITVAGIAAVMAFWFWYERRRVKGGRRDAESRPSGGYRGGPDMKISIFTRTGERNGFRRSLVAQKPLPNTPTIASWGMVEDDQHAELNVRNPPYTKAVLELASPMTPDSAEPTPTSSTPASRKRPPSIPIPMYTPKSYANPMEETPREEMSVLERGRGTLSLTSDEIENILDMATIYTAPTTPGTLQSSILQGVPPSPMPSFIVSQEARRDDYAARPDSSPRPAPTLASLAVPSQGTSTPGLLTPMTASTGRMPPQAQLPSSPTPSTPGFRPSIDAAMTPSSIGHWDFVTPSS
ncbi:hypothetical protein PsYK624_045790 [Phanerochaete sordida]|uniref:Uncharacterized protein n=1 Tax=Phanerochaete sordida TaxID=48140 RepID=A0A9P3LAK1_9APHY|nr:hypothetical protein PsYK624_045790 [Phanerochaete sordida]